MVNLIPQYSTLPLIKLKKNNNDDLFLINRLEVYTKAFGLWWTEQRGIHRYKDLKEKKAIIF